MRLDDRFYYSYKLNNFLETKIFKKKELRLIKKIIHVHFLVFEI